MALRNRILRSIIGSNFYAAAMQVPKTGSNGEDLLPNLIRMLIPVWLYYGVTLLQRGGGAVQWQSPFGLF